MRAMVALAIVAAATAARAGVTVPTPAATSSARPPSDEDMVREAAADQKRDELIRDLKAIIPKVQDGQQRADLLFQLAELWWEKARYASLVEAREFDDRYVAWLAARRKDEKTARAEPRTSSRRSDGFRQEALALYQTILRTYPGYPRQDELLFVVAYNQYEMGRKDEAIQAYQRASSALIHKLSAQVALATITGDIKHWEEAFRAERIEQDIRENSGLIADRLLDQSGMTGPAEGGIHQHRASPVQGGPEELEHTFECPVPVGARA